MTPPPTGAEEHRALFLTCLQGEETQVLRECIYALQGINGERIRFSFKNNKRDGEKNDTSVDDVDVDEYEGVCIQSAAVVAAETILPPDMMRHSQLGAGAMDCLRLCGEAGWLYTRIQSFLAIAATQSQSSSVARALAGAVEEELQSYRNFVAQLDAKSNTSTCISLRQILIETQPAILQLKTLAAITDDCCCLMRTRRNADCLSPSASGGRIGGRGSASSILTALHLHSQTGDGRHAQLAQRLLNAAAVPWRRMLHLWITQGVLLSSSSASASNDFFVIETKTNRHDDKFMWRDRFRIDHAQVPLAVLDKDLVEPAFLVGKGVNYIHKCLLHGGWSLQEQRKEESRQGEEIGSTSMDFDDAASSSYTSSANTSLRAQIEAASRLVHSHILTSLRDEHALMQHLFALKQFLLLGQGDFFSSLMDGIHAEYGNRHPTAGLAGIYRHDLASIVESALKSTNASSFPSSILQNLQVELLLDRNDDAFFTFGKSSKNSTAGAGDDTRTVWDIFSLSYTVPDPLIAIVAPATMALYTKMFGFLFRVRKVAFSLASTWRQSAVLQHALQTAAQRNAVQAATSPTYAQANVLLRKISILRQGMMHFVTNLKSYLMFEVLECGWKYLVRQTEHADSLDEVITAHDEYINGICQKSLLPTDDSALEGGDDDNILGDKVQELLLIASEFCSYQEIVFVEALEEAESAAEKRRTAEERVTEGDWGFQAELQAEEEDTFFGLADATKLHHLDVLSVTFHEQVMGLLKALEQRLNGAPAFKTTMSTTATAATTLDDAISTSVSRNKTAVHLDSLRFLQFQLNHNNYYGLQETS